ncbi:MAG: purine-binding chemotaxis protein CheW [Nitrospirae bacterium]|nr:purine-binding chemotaxis protein CheW [Candidatus Manganitrophaceae bacterium]
MSDAPPASDASEGALSPTEDGNLPSSSIKDQSDDTPEEPFLEDPEEVELLTFNLAEEEYAVDIKLVQEISKMAEMTMLPRTPAYIKGIITLRGNVIPVFDIRSKLGLPAFVKGPKSRFIICTTEKGRAAMLVDQVNDVARLLRYRLEPPPAGVAASSSGFIRNIARHGDRLLILLETEKVLELDRVDEE